VQWVSALARAACHYLSEVQQARMPDKTTWRNFATWSSRRARH